MLSPDIAMFFGRFPQVPADLYDLPMPLPTVAQLRRALPGDLLAVSGAPVPETPISAVHVSELADPTPFLAGGELLLTTGLSLPESALGLRAYVARLASADVAALGLGLGPHLDQVPPDLPELCEAAGLCLLVVPPASAFLTITKEYWSARSRSSQQELTDTLSAHGRIVSAMVSPDPTSAALRSLATSTGAWTALLDDEAQVQQVFPAGRAHDAVEVGRRLVDTRVTGLANVVTIPLHDETVAVFPLMVSDVVRGYLTVGSDRAISATARRLALTATALLSIDSVQRHRADAALLAERSATAALLDLGLVEPARRLAQRLDAPPVPETSRVLQLRTHRESDAVGAVLRWCPDVWPGPPERAGAPRSRVREPWFLVPSTVRDLDGLRQRLARVDPRASAALSETTDSASIHGVRVGLAERLAAEPDGSFLGPSRGRSIDADWEVGLEAVMAYDRTDLVGTLAAYLRHRGQWDAAARDLGVHRNTLRYRMERVSTLLACDVDDPDVASEMWLHLRRAGRA